MGGRTAVRRKRDGCGLGRRLHQSTCSARVPAVVPVLLQPPPTPTESDGRYAAAQGGLDGSTDQTLAALPLALVETGENFIQVAQAGVPRHIALCVCNGEMRLKTPVKINSWPASLASSPSLE